MSSRELKGPRSAFITALFVLVTLWIACDTDRVNTFLTFAAEGKPASAKQANVAGCTQETLLAVTTAARIFYGELS